MYIKNITIKNFRNFRYFSIDFTVGFQTIIGENNIGKSNLYRAMRIVLDTNLSYKERYLDEKDFHGFEELKIDSYILISIEFYSKNLANFPNFHVLKTTENTARVTYLFAHKSKFSVIEEETFDKIEIKDFQWKLYGSGESFELKDVLELNPIHFKDIEGINLYYISAFRNIHSDLFGSSKSLLSQYCQSRDDAENELEEVNQILNNSSEQLNKLEFIPNVKDKIKNIEKEIAGEHFIYPISLGFSSNYNLDAWNQLNIYFNPKGDKNIPINVLGLGQKNIMYLSLFLAKLINEQNEHEINILLIEEPEAHLHPQLQKILFSNLGTLANTQVFMTSHSTHIASDCEYKNLNILFNNIDNEVKSFSPFEGEILNDREELLLKRYLDATRSELFFASAVILVEGIAEQFIIPEIAKMLYRINLTENNISVIPIHSRYFDPFLKIFQNENLEIIVSAIIDGDKKEIKEDETYTKAIKNAKALEVKKRVKVFIGENTLENDIFPNKDTNATYLKSCFYNLGHRKSHDNLMYTIKDNPDNWADELIKRIDNTIKKGRFAQELSLLIDENFIVPNYIKSAIEFIAENKDIKINNGT